MKPEGINFEKIYQDNYAIVFAFVFSISDNRALTEDSDMSWRRSHRKLGNAGTYQKGSGNYCGGGLQPAMRHGDYEVPGAGS